MLYYIQVSIYVICVIETQVNRRKGTEQLLDITDTLKSKISNEHFRILLEYLGDIKYGSVTISIQDGKVVLIEKTEKFKTR
jgi:hypothetical protein